jgi:hypothetical protein
MRSERPRGTGVAPDAHIVDDAGDVLVEDPGKGIDAIQSALGFTLSADLENLIPTGIETACPFTAVLAGR